MKAADFDSRVPERLIPLTPPELRGEHRDEARMAVFNRAGRSIEHDEIFDFYELRRSFKAICFAL